MEEETMGNRREKSCREEKENKVSDFTDSAGYFPESWHGTKGWPDTRKTVSHVNVVTSHDRDRSRCKEGSWKYWLERWTSCWAWESQCSRNHGAKGLALPVRLFSWNERQ